ncbi:MAG: site-specific integrase [Rickettsiales bacterium]|jgi:site-specific recombinase XerD|nr:site-specific integrase [Rickettsiales bacterium]
MTNKLQYYIHSFFSKYLPIERNLSQNTIKSYRDTFYLLFTFFKEKINIEPAELSIDDMSSANILDYSNWLESDRNCSILTRNQRLSAIKTFLKYTQYKEPEIIKQTQEISQIKFKKFPQTNVDYLTTDQVTYLLSLPDTSTSKVVEI